MLELLGFERKINLHLGLKRTWNKNFSPQASQSLSGSLRAAFVSHRLGAW